MTTPGTTTRHAPSVSPHDPAGQSPHADAACPSGQTRATAEVHPPPPDWQWAINVRSGAASGREKGRLDGAFEGWFTWSLQ